MAESRSSKVVKGEGVKAAIESFKWGSEEIGKGDLWLTVG